MLWIYEPDGEAEAATTEELQTRGHLLATAAAAGISVGGVAEIGGSQGQTLGPRILFAGRKPKAEHLGRLRQADLFLDGAQYSVSTQTSTVDRSDCSYGTYV